MDLFTKEQQALEGLKAILKVLKDSGNHDTDYLSDYMQGFAEGKNSERRLVISMLEGILK